MDKGSKRLFAVVRRLLPLAGPAAVGKTIMDSIAKSMDRQVKKGGQTLESLVSFYTTEPEFMKLCKEVDIDQSMIEALAQESLSKVKE